MIGRIEALQTITSTGLLLKPGKVTKYSRTGINRPVFGGISVGNPNISAGTLGLVTYDNYVLT
ncbi:uncharacterized protein ig2599ANME_0323 [groundwater metagenome]